MKFRAEFTKATTLEELKAIYKKLAMANHPDRGGDVEDMKEINNLYDEFFAKLKNTHKNRKGETYTKETQETADWFKDIVNELMKMPGLVVEVIGCFIWVSGNTKANKEGLKKLGFRWHREKQNWYKSAPGYKKHNNKKHSMDEIRNMFGVQYEASTGTTEQIPA